ncbi:hypothetical protein NHX12_017685, partial [Muraenolepis orangiensis]
TYTMGNPMYFEAKFTDSQSAGAVQVPAAADYKEQFSPSKGSRTMQDAARQILLVTRGPTTTTAAGSTRNPLVESLCHLDRMYTRVRRDIFNTKTAYKYLKMGSCRTYTMGNPMYFEAKFTDSQSAGAVQVPAAADYKEQFSPSKGSRTMQDAARQILLVTRGPTTTTAAGSTRNPLVESLCHLDRMYTRVRRDIFNTKTAYKYLKMGSCRTYTMGNPMYFEAKFTDSQSAGKRICMIGGLVTEQAKFLTQTSKMSLKFSLSALVFKEMLSTPGTVKKIYLHCEIYPGPLTATESAKSCNYETSTKK